jgi:hypothetical protein
MGGRRLVGISLLLIVRCLAGYSVIVLAHSSQFYYNQPVSSYEKACSSGYAEEVTIAAVKCYFEGNS